MYLLFCYIYLYYSNFLLLFLLQPRAYHYYSQLLTYLCFYHLWSAPYAPRRGDQYEMKVCESISTPRAQVNGTSTLWPPGLWCEVFWLDGVFNKYEIEIGNTANTSVVTHIKIMIGRNNIATPKFYPIYRFIWFQEYGNHHKVIIINY